MPKVIWTRITLSACCINSTLKTALNVAIITMFISNNDNNRNNRNENFIYYYKPSDNIISAHKVE